MAQLVCALGRMLTVLPPNGHSQGQSIFQSQADLLLLPEEVLFRFTFGRLSVVYLQCVLQNGLGMGRHHRGCKTD